MSDMIDGSKMRYTDGKDQKGNKLPEPKEGEIAYGRRTGATYQLIGGQWKLILQASTSKAGRRDPRCR